MTDAFTEHGPECPKCKNKEVYIQRDGKTLRCWKCKHEFLGDWAKED
jgi:ribosomal protein L37AE/L43A